MPEVLNILLVTGEYPPAIGGVGDYTRQLARALIARGQCVSVLAPHRVDDVQEATEPAVVALGGPWNWRTWRRSVRVIKQIEPQIIHFQYQTGAYSMHPAINLLPWRINRLPSGLRPRIVVTAHDLRLPYLLPKADRLRTWVTSRLFNDADALIVTNADDERRVRGLAPPSRELYSPRSAVQTPVHLIPIGSNIASQPPEGYERAAWRQQLGVADDTVLIAYFGLLNRTKGVLELLEAIAGLPPRFHLLIIGGAAPLPDDRRYAAEVHALISAHNLRERVHITGPCSERDVSAHLLAADLAALPFHDGASYRRGSLIAALTHGLPTITTAPTTPQSPPLVDGVHALLVPCAEPGRLIAAIERLTGDAVLRERLATGARTLAAAFDWPSIATQHEIVYHTLLSESGGWK